MLYQQQPWQHRDEVRGVEAGMQQKSEQSTDAAIMVHCGLFYVYLALSAHLLIKQVYQPTHTKAYRLEGHFCIISKYLF